MSGKVVVIIPVLNEEDAILCVLNDIPDLAQEVIVVDNGSEDDTAARAAAAGARVGADQAETGKQARRAGSVARPREAEIGVFRDGDYGDGPAGRGGLREPLGTGAADLVSGSRV